MTEADLTAMIKIIKRKLNKFVDDGTRCTGATLYRLLAFNKLCILMFLMNSIACDNVHFFFLSWKRKWINDTSISFIRHFLLFH